jgi:hypothetical protein
LDNFDHVSLIHFEIFSGIIINQDNRYCQFSYT